MAAGGVLDAAAVFLPQRIADPVQTIFNAPVISPESKKCCCVGLPRRQTGDGILYFGGQLAFALGRSFQTNDLLEAWPAREKGHDPRTRLETARYNTTMLFAVRLCLAQIAVGFTLTGGGKTNE